MTKSRGRGYRAVIAFAAAGMLFCGCSGLSNQVTETTLAVDESGAITQTIVESKNGDDFTEKELSSYIQSEIRDSGSSVSSSSGGGTSSAGVRLDSCEVSGQNVRIVLDYDSAEDYAAFNGTDCFLGTLEQAESAGFSLNRTFTDESGSKADAEQISSRSDEWKVLIVEEPMNVRLPDKILYTSDGAEITGRLTAKVTGSDDSGTESAASEGVTDSSQTVENSALSSGGNAGTEKERSQELIHNSYKRTYIIFK